MSLHSLNSIRNLQDPLKQFQVNFTISMTPALLLAIAQQKATGLNPLSGNMSTVTAKELELRCTSFSYPGSRVSQTNDLVIAGFRRKIATIQNKSGVWECKVTEDQNGGVLNTIQSWIDLMHNPFTGLRLPSTLYVTTCVVDIISADPKRDIGRRIADPLGLTNFAYGNKGRTLWLKGFYPIEYTVGNIGASESGPVEVSIKFNYDWWTETPTGLAALGAL